MTEVNGANADSPRRGLSVFLSYAASDRAYARRLESFLTQRSDLRVFTTDALSAGEDWVPQLREQIAQSDVFVVLLSPTAIGSKWVLHELGAAWALEKPIIPVLTQPESPMRIPIELRDRKLVDFNSLDSPEAMAQLLEPYERSVLRNHSRSALD